MKAWSCTDLTYERLQKLGVTDQGTSFEIKRLTLCDMFEKQKAHAQTHYKTLLRRLKDITLYFSKAVSHWARRIKQPN